MIPNPYVILAAAALWAASCWYAYVSGETNKENKMRANYATQLETKIADHNDNARIDREAAYEWGERNGAARRKADKTAGRIDQDIRDNPQPASCRLSTPSVGLLNDAVHDANDLTPAPNSVPVAVPNPAGTDGRGGSNPASVGSVGLKPSR